MDSTKLVPTPPDATDPITWIAVALVTVLIIGLILGVPMLLRAVRAERRETLDAFRAEMAAERTAHATAVAALRAEHVEANARVHQRLDDVDTKLTTLVARSAA